MSTVIFYDTGLLIARQYNALTATSIQTGLSSLWSVTRQLADEIFLQEQLGQLGAIVVDFHDSGSDSAIEHVHDLELALKDLVGVELALEAENLADFEVSGAHQQAATVAHVLQNAWEALASGTQGSPPCY